MKKLFYLVVIISLPVLLFFQYRNWNKFSAPNNYDYQISEKIDVNYFDQSMVKLYFQNAQEIGSYARSLWFTDGVDVLHSDLNDLESKNKVSYYNFLMAQSKQIEKRLEESAKYKDKGYNNFQIKEITETGINPDSLSNQLQIKVYTGIRFGDLSQEVFQLQKRLSKKGYQLPVDGNFKSSTLEIVKTFQKENDLAPTGFFDEKTVKILLK